MVDDVKKNLEEPGATVGSRLEPVERFPGLVVSLLDSVFRFGLVADDPPRRAKQIVQVRHRRRFKIF
jgi:hypothetical protein